MPYNDRDEAERIDRLRRAMYSRTLSERLKDKPRRALEKSQEIVGEDWTVRESRGAGVRVAPRGIRAARSFLAATLIASIVFFLGAVGFFFYFFVLGEGSMPASPENIHIAVAGPPQVSGGAPANLQIVITNRNQMPLQLADLIVSFPPGTRSPTDYATDLPSTRIPLGAIEAGGQRQGTVSAVFSGTEGERASVRVELEYRIAGSNSIFVASSDYALTFKSSPLSISVDGKVETVSGQPVQLDIGVRSNADAPLRDVLLSVEYPFGFSLTSTNPKPTAGNVWQLGDFAPGQKKTVTVQGTLTGESGDQRVFRMSAGTRKSTDRVAIDTALAQNSYLMQVSQPFLGLSVALNRESSASAVVSPGDNVIAIVSYENNLPTEVTDAVIVARLSGVQIDGALLHSTDGFYRSADAAVIWDRTTTGGTLARLPPGAKGSVSFSFQIPKADDLKNISNPQLAISVNAAGKRVSEGGVPQNLQSTALKKIQLATDLKLVAQGLYYGNPFGSSGPLPPKVNTETTYAIVFTITNTTNKVTGAAVTARIPPYVRWIGIYSPSSEKVYFRGDRQTAPPPNSPCQNYTGDVCWAVGDIEPNTGVSGSQPRQAAIAIGFTPSASQIGQMPALMQSIRLSGIDAATGARITRPAGGALDVSSNILGDPGFTASQATVVK